MSSNQAGGHGASYSNGPLIIAQSKADAGWDIRPERHWDYTEGRSAQ